MVVLVFHIDYDSLRQRIIRLYSEKYGYLYHLEVEYEQRFQMVHLYHQVNSKVVNPKSEQDAEPLDYESLKEDNLFKETLRQNIDAKRFIINYQKELKHFIQELVQNLEEVTDKV